MENTKADKPYGCTGCRFYIEVQNDIGIKTDKLMGCSRYIIARIVPCKYFKPLTT